MLACTVPTSFPIRRCTVLFRAPKRQQLTRSIYCGVHNVVWNLNLAAKGLKKIKIKVHFFPKSAVKGLNSFQVVILQEKLIFVIFYDLFLKITTSDGRWGHLHRSSTGHLTLKAAIYGRISYLDCSYYGLCFTTNNSYASTFYVILFCSKNEKKINKHIFDNWRIVTNVLLNFNWTRIKTSNENEYVRCFVATHCLSFTISNRKSHFV